MKSVFFLLVSAMTTTMTACHSSTTDSKPDNIVDTSNCSKATLANLLTQQLETATTDADFVMYLEDWAGETFIYSRGTATMETLYESASTSKWVSAAVILTLVDKGMLSLEDTPQKYLTATEWPVDATSPLYSITLAQLLSFQSGLNDDAPCNNLPNRDFFECVASIAENNLTAGTAPGESFHYASNHLQVAGAMAVRAGGYADWTSLFTAFQQQTGLFVHSAYNLPSITNPRLAGGMTWTAMDYIDFIRAFKTSAFYSSGDIVSMASSDQVGATPISYSPAYEGVQEDWHYGFGMWIECHSPVWNCQEATLVSSPGAYGAYPFWNKKNDYIGIVARQGTLGTFRNGYALFDGVRSTVDSWAVCPKP